MKLAILALAATSAVALALDANRGEAPMMRGFVPKPALDIQDQLRRSQPPKAKKGPSVAEANGEGEGSAFTSRDIPVEEACVAPPGDRANRSDRQCENFCSSESFDGHAYADLVGTDTSAPSSEECLCFSLSDLTELSIASLTKTSQDLGILVCPTSESQDAEDREADGEEEESASSRENRDIPIEEACVAPATTERGARANRTDRNCRNYCRRESFDGHAFADLVGTDTSKETSAECLCFSQTDFTELSIASLTKTSNDLGILACPTSESQDAKDAKKRREAKQRASAKERVAVEE